MSNNNNKPKAEIRKVTPAWAAEKMKEHEDRVTSGFRQRSMNLNRVKRYATDMKSGNWGLNGQGLSFDNQGNLLDGQHRLAAVVMSGEAVDMLILWDVDPEVNDRVRTIDTIDTGAGRALAQQLKIDGFSYYAEIATTTRLLMIMASGVRVKGGFSQTQGVSVANLMQGSILHTLNILKKGGASKVRLKGYIIAPIVLLRTIEPDTADLFATEFTEMSGLSKTSPVLHFIKFLERPSMVRGGTDYQMLAMKALASALFSYSNDKKVEQIRGNDDHMEWLMKVSDGCIKKIREVAGIKLTVEELRS